MAGAEPLEIVPGLVVPVARPGHLIALKVLSRDDRTRPQDRVDLVSLLSRADATAVEEAGRALGRIMERGFHRGRSLVEDLEALVREPGR